MSNKSPSDATMQKWWRLAVLAYNGNSCAVCGAIRPPNELECHHLIKRRYRLLRNDYRNGVPVCIGECHRRADISSGQLIANHKHGDYLTMMTSRYTSIKDFLSEIGLTLDEFDKQTLLELKKIAKGQ